MTNGERTAAPVRWAMVAGGLTPHIAGATVRTVTVAAEAAAEEVRRWLDSDPPLNPC